MTIFDDSYHAARLLRDNTAGQVKIAVNAAGGKPALVKCIKWQGEAVEDNCNSIMRSALRNLETHTKIVARTMSIEELETHLRLLANRASEVSGERLSVANDLDAIDAILTGPDSVRWRCYSQEFSNR